MKPKINPLKPFKNELKVSKNPFKTSVPARSFGHIIPKGLIKPLPLKFSVGDLTVTAWLDEVAKDKFLKKMQ